MYSPVADKNRVRSRRSPGLSGVSRAPTNLAVSRPVDTADPIFLIYIKCQLIFQLASVIYCGKEEYGRFLSDRLSELYQAMNSVSVEEMSQSDYDFDAVFFSIINILPLIDPSCFFSLQTQYAALNQRFQQLQYMRFPLVSPDKLPDDKTFLNTAELITNNLVFHNEAAIAPGIC